MLGMDTSFGVARASDLLLWQCTHVCTLLLVVRLLWKSEVCAAQQDDKFLMKHHPRQGN